MNCSRLVAAGLSVGVALLLGSGCRHQASESSEVQIDWRLEPSPPTVGDAEIALHLNGSDGSPVSGAEVVVEGNMNHAGMKPSFAELTETAPGHYVGTLDFTMGGDWFLLVQGTLPDGTTVERKIDIPGVRSP
jgi:hypothetical protein